MSERPVRRGHKTTPPPLSLREIRFCQHWAETGNATRSYMAAGFTVASENAAKVRALRLLRNVTIREYIRELQTEAADAARVTVNGLAQSLRSQAYADRTGVFGPDGEMLPPGHWPKELRAIVAGIEVEELHDWETDKAPGKKKKVAVGLKWKVKFERSTEAKKLLAQWKGMLKGDVETAAGELLKVLDLRGEGA